MSPPNMRRWCATWRTPITRASRATPPAPSCVSNLAASLRARCARISSRAKPKLRRFTRRHECPFARASSQWRNPMIIRSGLIKNKDTVDFDEFTRHWRDVHGPLARIVPRMRAYSQNHIKRTILDSEKRGLHRVDGISQLRFDTVADMAVGVESPEQYACVVDIRGFLSDVTLLIQEEGELKGAGHSAAGGCKLMYLIKGDGGALERLQGALTEMTSSIGGSFRINRVINRDFRVDTTVPAGVQ